MTTAQFAFCHTFAIRDAGDAYYAAINAGATCPEADAAYESAYAASFDNAKAALRRRPRYS